MTPSRDNDRFDRLVARAPWGMHFYRLDADGELRFEGGNPTADTMLGIDHAALVGKSIEEAFPGLLGTTIPDTYRRVAREGGVWREQQVQYDAGGIRGVFEVVAFQTEAGHMVATFVDVADRIRMQEQLLQAQKMESVGRLAGGVAHDFNNLLTCISGNVAMLLIETPLGDENREALCEVKEAADRAAQLTRKLLSFSRKQLSAPRPLKLASLIEELRRMLARLIGEDIELNISLDPAADNILADPAQIEQLLVNLVVNARDAMPMGGTLLIASANVQLAAEGGPIKPGRYVRLSVADTGVGMPAEVKAHLFEPFFTTKPTGKGTGLGLSMVYATVQQHGGFIEVTSSPGQGTAFNIYFPQAAPAESAAPAHRAGALLPGSETILLVEDEATVRDLALRILQRLGYRVLPAANGEDALLLVERHPGPIALLLTDVVMPGMNGRELATRLTALRPDLKVLFTSGYDDEMLGRHGILDAGLNFIAKPYAPDELSRRLRELLDP